MSEQLKEHNATTFETPTARVFCVDTSKLALYERGNDDAWLSTEHAVNLRAYR